MPSASNPLAPMLKVVLPLGLIVGTVFGLTYISERKAIEQKLPEVKPGNATTLTREVLKFALIDIHYDPNSDYIEHRLFPGFFEIGDQIHWVSFWLQNTQPLEVEVTARELSCSSCSEARLAIVPAESRNDLMKHVAAASLASPFGTIDLLRPLAAVKLLNDTTAGWQKLVFGDPNAGVMVPPGQPGRPTSVLLQLGFKVKQQGPKRLTTTLAFRNSNTPVPVTATFSVGFVGLPAYDVKTRLIELGELSESGPGVSSEVVLWSATRDLTELGVPVPYCDDPHARFSPAIPLTSSELVALTSDLSRGGPVNIRSAYRIPFQFGRVSNSTGAEASPLDIGPIERRLFFTTSAQGTTEKPAEVTLRANVSGLVRLGGGATVLDLGEYSKLGRIKTTELFTDRTDLELETAPEATSPKYLGVTLDPPHNQDARRTWGVKIVVRPGDGMGDIPASSVIAFRVKGTSQLVRIPLKGRGVNR